MNINSEVEKVLLKVGLEEYEIENVFSRNRYLNTSTDDEVKGIVKYLYTSCKMDMQDIKKLILKNPLVLNESFNRINNLETIYKTLGIQDEKYRDLLNGFDKALSVNPKDLAESVSKLQSQGYSFNEIGDMVVKKPYLVIKNNT
jgi:hypothetical protein